ncbi:MAG: ABC transporter permease [Clostridium sp.]|nr:ABC transporter permease [Clostridium sp.]
MELRTIKYVVKEGFINTYKNFLMSIASMGVVSAALMILGLFLILTINIEHNTKFLREQPEMQIFCEPEMGSNELGVLEWAIGRDERIKQYEFIDKKEAFKRAEDMLGDDKDVLEGIDEDVLPASFIIKLNSSEDYEEVVKKYENYPGVSKVAYSQKVIDFIDRILTGLRIGSTVLILVLSLVAVFIISNTIKLTVFSRRREIGIMKYIGATDWFIRLPFIVEGIIIGLVGAVASFTLSLIIYKIGSGWVTGHFWMLSLVNMGEMAAQIMILLCLLGASVGALGSAMSIRKYLQV